MPKCLKRRCLYPSQNIKTYFYIFSLHLLQELLKCFSDNQFLIFALPADKKPETKSVTKQKAKKGGKK